MTLTIGSLFSGIGGLELGLERAGLGPVLWQVEKDDYCRRVLAKHWPHVPKHEDVRHVGRANLGPVDLICGGFPCQDISYAGEGAGLAGERSGLWYEFARIVREMGPRYVVVENVAALLDRGLDAVLGTLASLGYDAEWDCVPAASVGAPHRRDRAFLVAYAERQGRQGSVPHDGVFGGKGAAHALALHRPARPWLALDSDRERLRGGHGLSVGVERRRLHALGNAVVPQVAEFIGRRILASLDVERAA